VANGLPLTLGASLDLGEDVPARLPIDTGVSTGRAADLPASRASLPSGNVVALPGATDVAQNRDRNAKVTADAEQSAARTLTVLGVLTGNPALGAQFLDKRRQRELESAKMQMEWQKFRSELSAKNVEAVTKWATMLGTTAAEASTPAQMEAIRKGLDTAARETGVGTWALQMNEALLDPKNRDFAGKFPDFAPFVTADTMGVVAPGLVKATKEGNGDVLMWRVAVPAIDRTIRDRLATVLPALQKATKGAAIPFESAVELIAQGNRVVQDYLYGALPKEVLDVVGGARDGLLQRLTAAGVENPAIETEAAKTRKTSAAGAEGKRSVDDRPGSITADADREKKLTQARKEVEDKFKDPNYDKTVNEQLAIMGVKNPRDATPKQVAQAVAEADVRLNKRAAAQGAEAARTRLETPEKATPAEREKLAEDLVVLDKLTELRKIYKPAYVGPVRGSVGAAREKLGTITTDEAEFRASVASFRNDAIRKIAGLAQTVSEERRMTEELPLVTNPPNVFQARLKLTEKNLRMLAERRRTTLKETGVETKGLSPLPGDDPLGLRK